MLVQKMAARRTQNLKILKQKWRFFFVGGKIKTSPICLHFLRAKTLKALKSTLAWTTVSSFHRKSNLFYFLKCRRQHYRLTKRQMIDASLSLISKRNARPVPRPPIGRELSQRPPSKYWKPKWIFSFLFSGTRAADPPVIETLWILECRPKGT